MCRKELYLFLYALKLHFYLWVRLSIHLTSCGSHQVSPPLHLYFYLAVFRFTSCVLLCPSEDLKARLNLYLLVQPHAVL